MPELGSLSSVPFDEVLVVSFPDYRALHEKQYHEWYYPPHSHEFSDVFHSMWKYETKIDLVPKTHAFIMHRFVVKFYQAKGHSTFF